MCELSIDHYIYNDIQCTETHVFQPFSNQAAGATTVVKQRLTLQKEIQSTLEEQSEISRRTSLLYDHVQTTKPTSGELKTARDSLKQLCKLSAEDLQSQFSDLFTKFIHTARLLSHVALSSLFDHAGTICVSGKYVYAVNFTLALSQKFLSENTCSMRCRIWEAAQQSV